MAVWLAASVKAGIDGVVVVVVVIVVTVSLVGLEMDVIEVVI